MPSKNTKPVNTVDTEKLDKEEDNGDPEAGISDSENIEECARKNGDEYNDLKISVTPTIDMPKLSDMKVEEKSPVSSSIEPSKSESNKESG